MNEPETFFGWVRNDDEVARIQATLPVPLLKTAPPLDRTRPFMLSDIARKVIGRDVPKGPQKIGDCVSWAYSNLANYVAIVQIHNQLKSKDLLVLPTGGSEKDTQELQMRRATILEEYQEAATEVIYALSRVEVGGQRGSYDDGSVGAWAAKSLTDWGTLSRQELKKAGLSPDYDPKRAKEWGARGLPDSLEPAAKKHTVKTVTQVNNFDEAAALIQNGYPVAVCSNRGFTMTRDSQGFCSPSGVWQHAMLFFGCRFDRPGLACSQSWGPNTPDGPLDMGQPDNTFFVDAHVVDYMLAQRDSYTGSQFNGYEAQDLMTWKH